MPEASTAAQTDELALARAQLMSLAEEHPCTRHELFDSLATEHLNRKQVAALLRNYDAHASVLRRLLLHAASIMPEPAVPFVLENVRNEYGNGNYARNHQLQLTSLAEVCGVPYDEFMSVKIERGIKQFVKEAVRYYKRGGAAAGTLKRPAVTAGAITATELLAIKEFAFMQKAFSRLGQKHHIWFHHVSIELEHSDESVALALYFSNNAHGLASVKHGLLGVLDANVLLYDGLLAAIRNAKG
jgi:hypothetical protein